MPYGYLYEVERFFVISQLLKVTYRMSDETEIFQFSEGEELEMMDSNPVPEY